MSHVGCGDYRHKQTPYHLSRLFSVNGDGSYHIATFFYITPSLTTIVLSLCPQATFQISLILISSSHGIVVHGAIVCSMGMIGLFPYISSIGMNPNSNCYAMDGSISPQSIKHKHQLLLLA